MEAIIKKNKKRVNYNFKFNFQQNLRHAGTFQNFEMKKFTVDFLSLRNKRARPRNAAGTVPKNHKV